MVYLLLFISELCIEQKLDSVFVIPRIIEVLISVICLAFGLVDITYLGLDYSQYHKNLIQ